MNIEESNRIIAEFMGYTHYHPGIDIDRSDCGGLYDRLPVYSKVEILVEEYPNEDQYCFSDNWKVSLGDYRVGELGYDCCWNELMEVINKIESIYDDFHGHFIVYISGNSCVIQGSKLITTKKNFHPAYFRDHYAKTKINVTYEACVSFVNWYNKNLKK